MRSLLWWNLLPAAVAMLAYFAHANWEMTHTWWGGVLVTGFCALLLFYVFRWAERMNDLSVRKELEPRRRDLKKIIRNLESDNAGDEHQMRNIVFGLTENDGRNEVNRDSSKAIETWNRLIPSWREVLYLVVPTLVSAYCATLYQLDSLKPMFFQSTCAASVTFAFAFLILCIVADKCHKNQSLSGSENARYKTSALVTMWLMMLMLLLTFVAFLFHAAETKSRQIDKSNTVIEPDNESHR
jgi:Ca2+/Na+ antiporter